VPASDDTLIFVYNAKPGIVAGLLDTVHKTLSPSTYECDLCAITYGALSMRGEWRDWLKHQPWSAEFAYRDGFRAANPAQAGEELPAIFRRIADGGLFLLVSAGDFEGLSSVGDLIALLEARLNVAPAG
jgi:hypothetical protein